MRDIDQHVRILKRYQSASGAIVAAPNFPVYRYCWLRDGTFIAAALDRGGERESAEAFHRFVAGVIIRQRDKVEGVIRKLNHGHVPGHDELMHTRFTVDGHEGTEPWGNFQLDGYGTWLWGLADHYGGSPPGEIAMAAGMVIRYLQAAWKLPCFDPWEEHPDRVHGSTLAAIAGGLSHIAGREWVGAGQRDGVGDTVREILALIESDGMSGGVLGKWLGDGEGLSVDASCLWAFVPFGLWPANGNVADETIGRIERELRRGHGVKRYVGDTYYGGGDWLITTAWLAWCRLRRGERRRAGELLDWIEGTQVDGELPEQVPDELYAPSMYEEWVRRWGPIATPLLWSHAMYVLAALEEGKE